MMLPRFHRRGARSAARGLALALLLAVPQRGEAQDAWPFAPRAARVSDAVIARDLAMFDALAASASGSRARLYIRLAQEAYERNDDGALSASLLAAARAGTGGRTAASAARLGDAWETLERARGTGAVPSFALDSLEIALLRAQHPLLGAPSCDQWAARARAMAEQVAAQLASPAAARPVAPTLADAPPPPAIRRPGPLPDRVHFALDRATLSERSQAVLAAVADSLRDAGPVTITLEGHTDSRASDAYNDALSARRAESVRAWLVARGVEASRITVRAMGRTQLLTDATSPDAHASNRRVLMRFVAADGSVLATLEQRDDRQPETP